MADMLAVDDPKLGTFREQFKAAVQANKEWRDRAKEDYEFYFGKQWNDADLKTLHKHKRPAITINRIRPLINLLSGYQRLNRYEPDFLPRTADDIELCKVRKGITKYIFDSCHFNRQESRVFLDGIIGGIGWFEVTYEYDYAAMDGKAVIRRVSPFDMYLDPESREPDLSDAEYLCRCRWVDKASLIRTYPEYKEEIEAFTQRYDVDEVTYDEDLEPLWYSKDLKKARLIEHWYKEHTVKEYYVIGPGQVVDVLPPGITPVQVFRVPQTNIRCAVYLADVLLEDIPTPFKHGSFPFVPFYAYYLGEGDEPAGVVRDLVDVQREENKRRSQLLHLINTMANRGWFVRKTETDAMKKLKEAGSEPGVVVPFVNDKPQAFDMGQLPTAFVGLEQQASADFRTISGINEAMLGEEIPGGTSGRAIEMRQRQAVTQVAGLFDNLRQTKEMILKLLWGAEGRPGIVQQFYTEERTFRIVGENGQQQFITVNKRQFAGYDLLGNAIYRTLNDLTAGEFDIVVSEVAATPTQRIAQFYAMLELAKVLPPGTIPVDMIIDMSDFTNKEELKQRLQQQAQMATQQGPPVPKVSESINFKDLPPEGQVQMAAQAGIQLTPQAVIQQKLMQQAQRQVQRRTAIPGTSPGQGSGLVPQGMAAQAMQAAL